MKQIVSIQQSEHDILLLDSSHDLARAIINTGATQAEVKIIDPREITQEQRRKARAILGEISKWSTGYHDDVDYIHSALKYDFCIKNDLDMFSLSDCDVTTARLYITYLIDFCIAHGVPTRRPLYAFCDDLESMVYQCLCRRSCAVHNRSGADIHHCTGSRVGMGRNRKEIVHVGLVCLPLCRECHNEAHLSEVAFLEKHHISGLPLDEYLCNKLGLNTEAF